MSEELTIEAQAKAQGWNPDYSGANAKSAEQFIEDGEKIQPIQKERNDKLTQNVAQLTKEIANLKQIHVRSVLDAKQEGYNKKVSELKEQQLVAVQNADTDKFEKVQDKIDNLEKPEAPKVETKKQSEVAPGFTEFSAKNEWYMENDEMTAYADTLGERLQGNYDNTPAGFKKFYKAIEAGVKKVFPDDFGGQSSNAPDVETPSGQSSKRKTGASSLPPEALKMAKQMVAEGTYKTVEDYAKIYNGVK